MNCEVLIIRRFAAEDFRRKQFEFEDRFGSIVKAKSQAAPQGPFPNPTFFTMSDGKRSLLVASNAVQLSLSFEGSLPRDGIAAPLSKAVSAMKSAEDLFSEKLQYFEAIIVAVDYPADEVPITDEEQFTLATNKQPPSGFDSFGFSLAKRSEHFNILLEQLSLERVDFQVNNQLPGIALQFDPDFLAAPRKRFRGIKFDVNSKPLIGKQDGSRLDEIAKQISDLIREGRPFIGDEVTDDILRKTGL